MKVTFNPRITRTIATMILFLMPLVSAMAQDEDDPFADDVLDVPGAPLDQYAIIGVLLAIYIAFRFFKSRQPLKTSEPQ